MQIDENWVYEMHAIVVVIGMNCMELSECRYKFGKCPYCRGNSAKISLKTYNLECCSTVEFPYELNRLKLRTCYRKHVDCDCMKLNEIAWDVWLQVLNLELSEL